MSKENVEVVRQAATKVFADKDIESGLALTHIDAVAYWSASNSPYRGVTRS
jgi:hypothetical protein